MSDTSDLIGRIFDSRYQITALVGRGGMGSVYKAVHVAMNQTVALKVLHREMSRDERQVQRFYQEARASSRLKHPNTIKVFDFGRSDEGHLYLAMEFLEGHTLTQVIRREGALPVRRALNIVRQVAKSLAEAHMQGLVHRDLKPDNIFITQIYGEEDFVKVLDFGIAKFLQGNPEYGALTQAGLVCGTPLYLSPEQALGRTLDGRSDLYSLGVILYEMLAGVPPFRAETPVALVMRHIHDAPPPLGDGAWGIPERVRALVFALLDKDRDRRPASAEVLIRLLDDLMAGPLGSARPAEPSSPVPRVGTAEFGSREPPRGAVDRDAPTLYLSRSSADLVRGGHQTRASIGPADGGRRERRPEHDEETFVISRTGSVSGRPLVAPGPAPSPMPPAVRKVASSGPEDATVIEPPSHVPLPRTTGRSRQEAHGRVPRALMGLLVVTAGAAGVGVAILVQKPEGESPVSSGAPAHPPPTAGPPAARPEPAPPPPQEPPAARQTSLTIETVPGGAGVFLNDQKMGATPLVLTIREGDAPFTLRFVADGYEESRLTIDPTQAVRAGQTLHRVVLDRIAKEPPKLPPAARKAPARVKPPTRPVAPPVPALRWE